MCQLTLIHTGDASVNYMLAVNTMMENSRFANKDGCGVFNKKRGLKKTANTASNLLNLGEVIVSAVDTTPLMCHVRSATTTFNQKLLTAEHAHPFETEHYVFQHNGSLFFKEAYAEIEKTYKTKDLIDSEIFLGQLELGYTGDIVKDLQTTMDKFFGKFAFMIYHKPEDMFYVIRGRTAPLWKCVVEVNKKTPGIVINTDNDTVFQSILRASNCLQIGSKSVLHKSTETLKIETIYRLEEFDLKEVGALKENDREVVTTNPNFSRTTTVGGSPTTSGSTETGLGPVRNTFMGTRDITTETLAQITLEWHLTIQDLDQLAFICMGKGLIDFATGDKEKLLFFVRELRSRWNYNASKKWEVMTSYMTVDRLYKTFPALQFPYFLTEPGEYKEIYNQFSQMKRDQEVM